MALAAEENYVRVEENMRSTKQEAFPLLETKRLILRPMRPEDAKVIFRIYGDEEVMRYRDVLAFTRLEEAQQFLEEVRARYEQGEEMHWAITFKEEDSLIGSCGYSWHLGHHFGAIGYDLARLYWKQGIMTEAIGALLRFGFEVRNLHRIEARVRRGNEAFLLVDCPRGTFRYRSVRGEAEAWQWQRGAFPAPAEGQCHPGTVVWARKSL